MVDTMVTGRGGTVMDKNTVKRLKMNNRFYFFYFGTIIYPLQWHMRLANSSTHPVIHNLANRVVRPPCCGYGRVVGERG